MHRTRNYLNELLHNTNQNRENLIVTAIDITYAFRSAPHELIMSTMRQRKFPEWTEKTVRGTYQYTASTIEMRGTRSDKINGKGESNEAAH
jgi:hypothetical protein